MKIFRIINKNFKDAFRSIVRNFSLSMASVSCTAITLILVAISILATYNVNYTTKKFENILTVVAFVDSKATDEDIKRIEREITDVGNIGTLVYNSKDDIKNSLSENEDLKEILNTLDENPVQPTFVIHVDNVKKISETAEKIKSINQITNVKYGESLVNKLLSSFDVIRNGCLIAVVALILVTAFLIGNTIKITIFSRRTEINIMRLVGTSNSVIKMPFLIEGAVLGFIGSLIPVLITIYGYQFLYDSMGGVFLTDLIEIVKPNEIVYNCSLVLIIVGVVVGMFGSIRAVRKYLKI